MASLENDFSNIEKAKRAFNTVMIAGSLLTAAGVAILTHETVPDDELFTVEYYNEHVITLEGEDVLGAGAVGGGLGVATSALLYRRRLNAELRENE